MLRNLFGRRAKASAPPAADLYFANACREWLEGGRVTRHGPTVFASATTRLVIRDAGFAAPDAERARTIYLIDEAVDLDGATASSDARSREARKAAQAALDALLPGAAAAVASSAPIAEMLRARQPALDVRLITPYWATPPAPLDHHRAKTFRIACLSSESHRAEIEPLSGMLAELLRAYDDVELILAGGHEALPAFKRHPRVRALGPLGWPEYRARLARLQPHVALYPLQGTAFNAARSMNKLIEHGVAGAAGLYAKAWPGAGVAEAAGAGMALPEDPAAWKAAIEGLMFSRERAASMAAAGRALSDELNDMAAQRALWTELLEI